MVHLRVEDMAMPHGIHFNTWRQFGGVKSFSWNLSCKKRAYSVANLLSVVYFSNIVGQGWFFFIFNGKKKSEIPSPILIIYFFWASSRGGLANGRKIGRQKKGGLLGHVRKKWKRRKRGKKIFIEYPSWLILFLFFSVPFRLDKRHIQLKRHVVDNPKFDCP